MKAVKDYVEWILTYGDVLRIATDLQWTTISQKIAKSSLDVLKQMSCTRLHLHIRVLALLYITC